MGVDQGQDSMIGWIERVTRHNLARDKPLETHSSGDCSKRWNAEGLRFEHGGSGGWIVFHLQHVRRQFPQLLADGGIFLTDWESESTGSFYETLFV